jgi:hypothetical protein
VSLAGHAERGALRQIERYTGAAIAAHVIPGLEPRARSAGHDRAGGGAGRSAGGKESSRNAHHRASDQSRKREDNAHGAGNRGWSASRASARQAHHETSWQERKSGRSR